MSDSKVQTFVKGGENQFTKRKTEIYVFSGFGVSISFGWEWKSTIGRFTTGRFWPFTWKTSSVGKDKVNNWEFCTLKITTIFVLVIVIQRIFPSSELVLTHFTIVIWRLSIYLFSFINEVDFSCQWLMKMKLWIFLEREYKRGRIRIRIHLVSLPLLIAQCSLNSTNFLSKYRSCKRPSCSDPVVTVALIIKWLQTEHNYAFWDLWYCWKTFQSRHLYKQLYRNWRTTLAHPTSWQLYQVRSWTSWAWISKYFFHYSRSIH